ncbi:hypothetical protein ACH3XW_8470 [Acanthocheilonema viteae]
MQTKAKSIKALLLQEFSNPPDDSSETSDQWEVDHFGLTITLSALHNEIVRYLRFRNGFLQSHHSCFKFR